MYLEVIQSFNAGKQREIKYWSKISCIGVHSRALSGKRLADSVRGPVRGLLWMSIRILLFAIKVRLRAERHSGRTQADFGAPFLCQESETAARGLVRSQGWPLWQGRWWRRRGAWRWWTRRKCDGADWSKVAWSFSRSWFHSAPLE